MKRAKRLSVIILGFLLIMGVVLPAQAHDVPNLDQTGKINIGMYYGETPVGGGKLALYRVGDIQESNGDYSFVPTGEFTACGNNFDDFTSKELAGRLMEYAKTQGIEATHREVVDSKGKIRFAELELGLYMVVQEEAAKGYSVVNPFLVSVPYQQDGTYSYEVDATPKIELEKEPEQETHIKLPQTGQLNWPIPVLMTVGVVLLGVGAVLCCGKRRKNEE